MIRNKEENSSHAQGLNLHQRAVSQCTTSSGSSAPCSLLRGDSSVPTAPWGRAFPISIALLWMLSLDPSTSPVLSVPHAVAGSPTAVGGPQPDYGHHTPFAGCQCSCSARLTNNYQEEGAGIRKIHRGTFTWRGRRKMVSVCARVQRAMGRRANGQLWCEQESVGPSRPPRDHSGQQVLLSTLNWENKLRSCSSSSCEFSKGNESVQL